MSPFSLVIGIAVVDVGELPANGLTDLRDMMGQSSDLFGIALRELNSGLTMICRDFFVEALFR